MAFAGLVCVGGEYITGYDPRQEGSRPAFIFTYSRDIHDYIWTMTSGGLPGCGGPSQLLTGVLMGNSLFDTIW